MSHVTDDPVTTELWALEEKTDDEKDKRIIRETIWARNRRRKLTWIPDINNVWHMHMELPQESLEWELQKITGRR